MITLEEVKRHNNTYKRSIEHNFEEDHKELLNKISKKIEDAAKTGYYSVKIEISTDEVSAVEMEYIEQILIKSGFTMEYLSGYIFHFGILIKWK